MIPNMQHFQSLAGLIETMRRKQSRVVFVSPHLDDAVYSAGALITTLIAKKIPVTVINCFTSCSRPYTLSAKAYLAQCGYNDAQHLYQDRKKEDLAIWRALRVTSKYLDIEDALFRKLSQPNSVRRYLGHMIPELLHLYPTYRWHIVQGDIQQDDRHTIETISQAIRAEKLTRRDFVFAPMGHGNHCDHRLAKTAAQGQKDSTNVLLWADFPY